MEWWKNHLDLDTEGQSVGFCGAGGKTTCLWQLSEELIKTNKNVLITTTTHMYPYENLSENQIVIRETFNQSLLERKNRVQWFSKINSENKGCSPKISEIEKMNNYSNWWRLIELDGSRNLPIKAPKLGEPVFIKDMNIVFGLISMEVLGREATESLVQHLDLFLEVTSLKSGEQISLEAIQKLIESPKGLFANKPSATKAVVLLNKVRTEQLKEVEVLKSMVSLPIEICLWKEV